MDKFFKIPLVILILFLAACATSQEPKFEGNPDTIALYKSCKNFSQEIGKSDHLCKIALQSAADGLFLGIFLGALTIGQKVKLPSEDLADYREDLKAASMCHGKATPIFGFNGGSNMKSVAAAYALWIEEDKKRLNLPSEETIRMALFPCDPVKLK